MIYVWIGITGISDLWLFMHLTRNWPGTLRLLVFTILMSLFFTCLAE